MSKRTMVAMAAALAATVAARAEAQEHGTRGWAEAHCSAEAVRDRNALYWDETTLEGLFALASMERECWAAAAESAEPEAELVLDRPWTAFCSDASVRSRHPNANTALRFRLYGECTDALQAAADAEQELRRCEYTSVSECRSDDACAGRPIPPAADERWLEVPPLDADLATTAFIAERGDGPWPTVRRCDAQGCDRIRVMAGRAGAYFILQQADGPWFVKVEDTSVLPAFLAPGPTARDPFVEVATLGLNVLVYYGNCADAFPARPPR